MLFRSIGLDAIRGAPVFGTPMAQLLGALGEMTLPTSGIVVRIPTEKLYHINGTPREAFVTRPALDEAGLGVEELNCELKERRPGNAEG